MQLIASMRSDATYVAISSLQFSGVKVGFQR